MITIQIEPHSHFVGDILKTQKSSVIFDLCLEKTLSGKSREYRDVIVFKKTHFSKYIPSKLRRNEGVLKFLQFEEHFGKVSYSWRISCVQLG